MPETTRLTKTIEAWWPQTKGLLDLGVTNARTEGYNRVIKQVERAACGFPNQSNDERGIELHVRPGGPHEQARGRGRPRRSVRAA